MSRSVKSYNSSLSRKEKVAKQAQNAQIKQRIKEILHSVKEQRQHIENRLHQNDIQIQRLKQDYELLRYQNDFDNPSPEEETIIKQLAQGLRELSIDPIQILGACPSLGGAGEGEGRKLSKEEVIRVQEVLLLRLQGELYK